MRITEVRFRELYEKYKNLILRQVYDMTKDYHLAQDICQETFMKLYDYRAHIDEEKVKGWLLVVAYNKTCDILRRNPLECHAAELDYQNCCSHILQSLREKNAVWYEMLILFDYFGMPKKEIGKRMGVPVGTVDTYLRRCKKWLKENFREVYKNDTADDSKTE